MFKIKRVPKFWVLIYVQFTPQAKSVVRVAVGIGKNIAHEELETIAGEGSVATASDFHDLDNQLGDIRSKSCGEMLKKKSEMGVWGQFLGNFFFFFGGGGGGLKKSLYSSIKTSQRQQFNEDTCSKV